MAMKQGTADGPRPIATVERDQVRARNSARHSRRWDRYVRDDHLKFDLQKLMRDRWSVVTCRTGWDVQGQARQSDWSQNRAHGQRFSYCPIRRSSRVGGDARSRRAKTPDMVAVSKVRTRPRTGGVDTVGREEKSDP